MSVAELQLKLHQTIDSITDSDKLKALYTLLKGSEPPFHPMDLKDYIHAIDEARQQIKEGKSSSTDELEKESENW
jgi:hypothetical protein